MAGFKLENFKGLIPRLSDRLLPTSAATVAENVKLLNGELRGYRDMREEKSFVGESFILRRAYRVPDTSGFNYADSWLLFDSRDVDITRSPVINDSFNRYYWANDQRAPGNGRPMYNTEDRIANGDDPYFLGVPAPTAAPGLTPPAGTDLTRAYVYTFVSEFGEEGQPSAATLDSGDAGTWVVDSLETTVPDIANKSITHKNIYRTVPGQNSSLFFFVTQVTLATTSYNDIDADDVVALNSILESTDWAEPPTTIEGWALMPNGYLVAWDGRRILMSEPYRPHAWPAKYELALDFEVVAMGVWGSTLVIGTKSQPSLGRGTSPAAFTLQKLDNVEPCLSRRGMVSTSAGVYYPSQNGLMLVNGAGVNLITQDTFTKEEWATFNPEDIYATQLGLEYIAFNGTTNGFIFNPTEPGLKFIELNQFINIVGIETDRYTGNVLIIKSNRVFNWDPPAAFRLYYRWKSKLFQVPKPINLGALKISFNTEQDDVSQDILATFLPYNQDRLSVGSLNTLGGHAMNAVQNPGQLDGTGGLINWLDPEIRTPLGGSPLFPLNSLLLQASAVRIIVYARRTVVLDLVVPSERTVRIPSGFKSDLWQFELISNTDVFSLQVATSPKELAKV